MGSGWWRAWEKRKFALAFRELWGSVPAYNAGGDWIVMVGGEGSFGVFHSGRLGGVFSRVLIVYGDF